MKPARQTHTHFCTTCSALGVLKSLALLTAVLLSACQSPYTKLSPKADLMLSDAETQAVLTEYANLAHVQKDGFAVYCTGLFECHIASIDSQLIVNAASGRPYRAAFEKNHVAFVKHDDKVQTVGIAPSGKHDINVRIYPASLSAYEQFVLVQQFDANAVYRIHAYRKLGTPKNTDMSLLALAVPKPLCVKVYRNKRVIRQFCKISDITTGLGEFTEVTVDVDSDKPSMPNTGEFKIEAQHNQS